eukprot:m.179598 g.179598  ORF g.179598 m.179598 type:complete len:507 (-) comp14803_c0_seq1:206-1726(-)
MGGASRWHAMVCLLGVASATAERTTSMNNLHARAVSKDGGPHHRTATHNSHQSAAPEPVVKFGIVTDVHYADAPPGGTRVYRDSIPKMRAATTTFNGANLDFIISLGDLKDTDATKGCTKPNVAPSSECVNLTVGFLHDIDAAMAAFDGPRFHLLGNHDVDILSQPEALGAVVETPPPPPPAGSTGGPGYSSWSLPMSNHSSGNHSAAGSDVVGCLVTSQSTTNVWVIHPDGTRNWLSASPSRPEWQQYATTVNNISVYPKRYGGQGAYDLNATACQAVVANRCAPGSCHCDPTTGKANLSSLPVPASPPHTSPIRFIRLNADYTDNDLAWSDLDNTNAVPGQSWEHANVPSFQLTWLANELDTAASLGQHVIVFVHFRVDGGPSGPVGTGLGPSSVPNRAWVDDCSLENAHVVRDVLEARSGLVLAVFSGHDHVPLPPYTKATTTSPLYFTHHALVEGAWPHNAYSVVSVMDDCSIIVQGFVDAYNLTMPGPPGHNCSSSLKHMS